MRASKPIAHVSVCVFLLVVTTTFAQPPLPGRAGLANAQTDPQRWMYTGSLNLARFQHTATLMPSGKVLVVGGGSNGLTNTAELYDPATGTWSSTGSLHLPRTRHTATLLPNGKVLVAGGIIAWSGPVGTPPVPPTNSAELYDPATETWSLTGNMISPRAWHSAALLRNGKVLVVGGLSESGYNFWSNSLATTETYDPATGTWSVTGSLHIGRVLGTATQLQNGMVLVVGGTDTIYSPATVDEEIGNILTSAELYDSGTGSWRVTGELNTPRCVHTATLLPNGKVLVVGGGGPYIGYFIQIINTSELYDPATGTWSYTGNLTGRRWNHTATLLPNGQVLVAGGANFSSESDDRQWITLTSSETYDPVTGNWSTTTNMNVPRFLHTMTLLSNGKVLAVGGFNGCCNLLASAELYDSGSSSPSNPIDDPQFFVRQHYLDFLNREPEPRGFEDWMNVLNSCLGDSRCLYGPNGMRTVVSQSFFGSQEFNLKGGYVFRFYKSALGRLPTYDEMIGGMAFVTGATEEEVYQKRAEFATGWVTRTDFLNSFPRSLPATQFVDNILQTAGITLENRDQVISDLAANNTDAGRAIALRSIVESQEEFIHEFNSSFVYMQYVGYLRRDPDPNGYNEWLSFLNAHPEDINTMVWGFVDSAEYRRRFGP